MVERREIRLLESRLDDLEQAKSDDLATSTDEVLRRALDSLSEELSVRASRIKRAMTVSESERRCASFT